MNLNTQPDPARHAVAILGGGAAGALTAIRLLRAAPRPLRIALVEARPEPGRGPTAPATTNTCSTCRPAR